MDFIQVLWAAGNVVLIVVFAACVTFAVAYPLLFDPSTTTAGKAIWRVGLALAGLATVVVIGIFLENPNEWWVPGAHITLWRVVVRLAIYAWVAWAMVALDIVIFLRRFMPHRVKTAPPGEDTLDLRPRQNRRRR